MKNEFTDASQYSEGMRVVDRVEGSPNYGMEAKVLGRNGIRLTLHFEDVDYDTVSEDTGLDPHGRHAYAFYWLGHDKLGIAGP